MSQANEMAQRYQRLFEHTGEDGRLVLEDLIQRYTTQSPYVQGGQNAEREGCYRMGKRAVVEHIIKQINRANGADHEELHADE